MLALCSQHAAKGPPPYCRCGARRGVASGVCCLTYRGSSNDCRVRRRQCGSLPVCAASAILRYCISDTSVSDANKLYGGSPAVSVTRPTASKPPLRRAPDSGAPKCRPPALLSARADSQAPAGLQGGAVSGGGGKAEAHPGQGVQDRQAAHHDPYRHHRHPRRAEGHRQGAPPPPAASAAWEGQPAVTAVCGACGRGAAPERLPCRRAAGQRLRPTARGARLCTASSRTGNQSPAAACIPPLQPKVFSSAAPRTARRILRTGRSSGLAAGCCEAAAVGKLSRARLAGRRTRRRGVPGI